MLTLFDFRAHFPRVIGTEQPTMVMAKCCLGCRTNQRQRAHLLRSVAGDSGKTVKSTWRRETTGAWIVFTRKDEASDSDIPECIGGQRVRQMAEGHGRHVRMQTLSCSERRHQRRNRRVDPELAMNTLNQLQVGLELPCDLPENLILFVCSRELGIGARLAVVVAKVLISRKEPNSIAVQWTAEIRREVTVLDAFISAGCSTTRPRRQDRLAGQT